MTRTKSAENLFTTAELFLGQLIHNRSEGEIHPGGAYFFGGWQSVQPVCLCGAGHYQQAAMLQVHIHPLFGHFMFEGEFALSAKTYRTDGPVSFQVFFSITVPGHAFLTTVVEVEQAGVEGLVGSVFDDLLQRQQLFCPWQGLFGGIGVGVIKWVVSVPGHLSLVVMCLPKMTASSGRHSMMVQELMQVMIGFRDHLSVVVHRAVVGQQVAFGINQIFK